MVVVVGGARVKAPRNILPCEDGAHARHRECLVPADGQDLRVRMNRAQHLEMQHPFKGEIHRVAGLSGNNGLRDGTLQA